MAFGITGALVLLIAAWYLHGNGTPSGQPALMTLRQDNFAEFRTRFDARSDRPRLLLLASPT